MSTSTLLNEVVTEMAKQKGYAYTAGYLQSMLMELSYGLRSKKLVEQFEADLQRCMQDLAKNT